MSHRFGNSQGLVSSQTKPGFAVGGWGIKALSLVAAAAVMAAGQAASATTTSSPQIWAGYALTSLANNNNTFINVSASFVVPAVTPATATGISAAAFWVGLDGDGSQRIEQIGVIAEAETGYSPYYYAFLATGNGTVNPIAQVQQGDNISVAVSYNSSTDKYGLYIDDSSQLGIDETVTPSAGTNPPPASAEWIAEAPGDTATGTFYPLANFGSVTFTGASATDSAGATGAINAFNNTQLTLVPNSGLGAQASGLSADGTQFTVTVATPEPAALGLMSMGGLAILFARRKRR